MGATVVKAGPENFLMSRDCPFCKRTHRSPYVDELEEAVMACRDKAPLEDRGILEEWEDFGTWAMSEIEAFSGP